MARKRKYQFENSADAAEFMLENLKKFMREGKDGKPPEQLYKEGIERFLSDPAAQDRYVSGVTAWIRAMRLPAVKQAIRSAIKSAKDQYDELVEKIRVEVRRVTAAARTP